MQIQVHRGGGEMMKAQSMALFAIYKISSIDHVQNSIRWMNILFYIHIVFYLYIE